MAGSGPQARQHNIQDAVLVALRHLFFFSSRRRHTRLQGDWSSDVCSSDLVMVLRSLPWSMAPSTMWRARLTEPRLQTAVSVSLVFSVISVHRLDECTTPACCWGERTLQGSLKVTQGWPVSNSMDSILRHRSMAGMRLNSLSSPLSALVS